MCLDYKQNTGIYEEQGYKTRLLLKQRTKKEPEDQVLFSLFMTVAHFQQKQVLGICKRLWPTGSINL